MMITTDSHVLLKMVSGPGDVDQRCQNLFIQCRDLKVRVDEKYNKNSLKFDSTTYRAIIVYCDIHHQWVDITPYLLH